MYLVGEYDKSVSAVGIVLCAVYGNVGVTVEDQRQLYLIVQMGAIAYGSALNIRIAAIQILIAFFINSLHDNLE